MSLIEGVGDEVTDFFIVVGVLFVGWVAWCSTSISEQPLIRTVLILQHRTRTRIAELRANNQTTSTLVANIDGTTNNRTPSTAELVSEEIIEATYANHETEQSSIDQGDASPRVMPEETAPAGTTATASEETLIEAMDSLNDNASFLRQNLEMTKSDAASSNTSESAQKAINPIAPSDSSPTNSVVEDTTDLGDEMTIKLKYINDDQKIVTGRPNEKLGDFKKRHFKVELDAQMRVRLVFNGHVLQPDTETLEKCGIYDNCVVHCLIHQQRPPSSNVESQQSVANVRPPPPYPGPPPYQSIPTSPELSVHNEWDLGRLLSSILTVIIIFAWYSRYHYSQFFTSTTTLALYALTAIFAFSILGQFFPDQDTLGNVQ